MFVSMTLLFQVIVICRIDNKWTLHYHLFMDHTISWLICNRLLSEMRRYIDTILIHRATIRIQWPSAIYHDTTLTFIIGKSHCVVTVFAVFDRLKIHFLEKVNFLILSFHYMLCKHMQPKYSNQFISFFVL